MATQWISVKDKLPETNGPYLVFTDVSGGYAVEEIEIPHIRIVWFFSGYGWTDVPSEYMKSNLPSNYQKWKDPEHYRLTGRMPPWWVRDNHITHWMPIPETPE